MKINNEKIQIQCMMIFCDNVSIFLRNVFYIGANYVLKHDVNKQSS